MPCMQEMTPSRAEKDKLKGRKPGKRRGRTGMWN